MFGPGVSTMPNETRAKPSKAERWGIFGLAGAVHVFLTCTTPQCHFVNCTESNSVCGGGLLPLQLAGEGWGGGANPATDAKICREISPTRRASRVDLPRKRER